MSDSPFYHLAFIVGDLEAAMDAYEPLLGVRFREPEVMRLAHVEEPGFGRPEPHPFEVRLTYSLEGPPYYELVEAGGDTLFAAAHGEGLHHVGVWSEAAPDAPIDVRMLTDAGKTFAWFTAPAGPAGVRVEFVDARRRGRMDRWWARATPRQRRS
jgi:hypothetical protein